MNSPERSLPRLTIVAILASFGAGLLYAQSDVDPSDLLRPALEKVEQAKQSKTRFTYLDLNHTQNFNEKGKSTADFTQLFEVTYIADLEYSRLLEVDGKPLTGKDLEKEQNRYDKAVHERAALDANARAKLQHHLMKSAGVDLSDFLTEYRSVLVGHATLDGRDCVVLDATPVSASRQKHYKIWVDPATHEMIRLDFTQLADEGDILRGGTGTLVWTFIDGIPLTASVHLDESVLHDKKKIHVVVDHTYSRFRKFSVTTTILPVGADEKQ